MVCGGLSMYSVWGGVECVQCVSGVSVYGVCVCMSRVSVYLMCVM